MVEAPAIVAMAGHSILKAAKVRQAVLAEKMQQLTGWLVVNGP